MTNSTRIRSGPSENSPQHISTVVLDEIVRAAGESFTANQLFYLGDAFIEAAREKRDGKSRKDEQ